MTLLTRSRKSPKLTFEVVIVVDDFFSNREDRQDNFIPQRYQRRHAPTRVNSGTLVSVSVTGRSLEYHAKIAWRTITSSLVGRPLVIKRARCDTSCVRRCPSFSLCACFQSVVYERSLFKPYRAWKCVSEQEQRDFFNVEAHNMWILTEGEDCLPFQ
jgi:hypothetical protein